MQDVRETDEKGVVRRFYELEFKNPEQLDEVCSPDMIGHAGAGADLQELKNSVASFVAAFPDLELSTRYLVQEGELVSAWVSYAGTHGDDFAGVPASGRSVKFPGWDLFRVRDGQIVEITQYCDLLSIMSQIGALPTVTPA